MLKRSLAIGLLLCVFVMPVRGDRWGNWRQVYSRAVQAEIDGQKRIARGRQFCRNLLAVEIGDIPEFYRVPEGTPKTGDRYCG